MISGDALVVCLSAVLRLRVAGYYHKYYSYEKYEATIGRGDGVMVMVVVVVTRDIW